MRSLIVGFLVVVGALMTIPGGVAVWQERVFLNEDTFVSTVDEAFEQEEVQFAIAEQLTDVIMERAEIEDRIASGLANLEGEQGADLALLEGPLTGLAREAVFRSSLRLIEAEPLEAVREAALRSTHRLISAPVFDDQAVIAVSGDDLVLDLGVVLDEVIKDLGGGEGDGVRQGRRDVIAEQRAAARENQAQPRPADTAGLIHDTHLATIQDQILLWVPSQSGLRFECLQPQKKTVLVLSAL